MKENNVFRVETSQLVSRLEGVSSQLGVELIPESLRNESLPAEVSVRDLLRQYPVRAALFNAFSSGQERSTLQPLVDEVSILNTLNTYVVTQLSEGSENRDRILAAQPLVSVYESMERGRVPVQLSEKPPIDGWTNLWTVSDSIGMSPRSKEFQTLFNDLLTSHPDNIRLARTHLGIGVYIDDDEIPTLREWAQESLLPPPLDNSMTINEMATILGVEDTLIQRHLGDYALQGRLARSHGRNFTYFPRDAFFHVISELPQSATEEYVSLGAMLDEFQERTGKKPSQRIRGLFNRYVSGEGDKETMKRLSELTDKPLVQSLRSKFQGKASPHVHRFLATEIEAQILRELEALPPVADEGWESLKGISKQVTALDPQHRDRRQAIEAILSTFRDVAPNSELCQNLRPTEAVPNAALHYAPTIVQDVLYIMGSQPMPELFPEDIRDQASRGFRGAKEYFLLRYPDLQLERDMRDILSGGKVSATTDQDGVIVQTSYEVGKFSALESAVARPLPVTFLPAEKHDGLTTHTTVISQEHQLELFTVEGSSVLASNIGESALQRLLSQLNIVNTRQFGALSSDQRANEKPASMDSLLRTLAEELSPSEAVKHLKEYQDIVYFLQPDQREGVLVADTTRLGIPMFARFLTFGAGSVDRFVQSLDSARLHLMLGEDKSPIIPQRNKEKVIDSQGFEVEGYETLIFVRPNLDIRKKQGKVETNTPERFPLLYESLVKVLEVGCRQAGVSPDLAEANVANAIGAVAR